MRPLKYTQEQLKLLADPNNSITELVSILGINSSTVSRARKRFGFVIPDGPKLGKPQAYKNKKVQRSCADANCTNIFDTVPSKNQRYCSHSCCSRNMDFSYRQTEEDRAKRRKPHTPEYKRYANRVHKLSNKVYNENIDVINPNRHKRTLCGIEDGWQLDHILTIKECFQQGLSPEEASHVSNLRMLPWKQNLMRQYDNT